MFEDSVEDGGGQVGIMEHPSPRVERLVGGEDHRPLAEMPVVDHVVQHVGGVGAIGQVTHLVDNQHMRMRVRLERLVEAPVSPGVREVLDQLRGGGEERLEAVLDSAVADGDGEMGLAATGLPMKDERPAFGHEIGTEVGAEQRHAQAGLQGEVEVVDGLEVREVSPAREPLQASLLAVRDLFGDQQGEEVAVRPLLVLGPRDRIVVHPAQVGEMKSLEQSVELDLGKIQTRTRTARGRRGHWIRSSAKSELGSRNARSMCGAPKTWTRRPCSKAPRKRLGP